MSKSPAGWVLHGTEWCQILHGSGKNRQHNARIKAMNRERRGEGKAKIGKCPVCEKPRMMTRHHIIPVSCPDKRGPLGKNATIRLCADCHRKAHKIWGASDWRGPRDPEALVSALREWEAP